MKTYINLSLTVVILQTFGGLQQTRADQGLGTNFLPEDAQGSYVYTNRVPPICGNKGSTNINNEATGVSGRNKGYGADGTSVGNTEYNARGVSYTSNGNRVNGVPNTNNEYGVGDVSGGNIGYGIRDTSSQNYANGVGGTPNMYSGYGVGSTNGGNNGYGVGSTNGANNGYGVGSTNGGNNGYGVGSTNGGNNGYGVGSTNGGNNGYDARNPNYSSNGNGLSGVPNTNSGYVASSTTNMNTGYEIRDTTNSNYANGVSGTSVTNDQTTNSGRKEMINQSRKQLMESLKTGGANRVIDVLDTASVATKVADNVMTGITDLNNNGLGLTNRVAMRKIKMGGKAMEAVASGAEGLIGGAEQIGGAGVEATKSVYNPAVATTANIIRGSGRVVAIPLKVAKTVTGFVGGERTKTTTPTAAATS